MEKIDKIESMNVNKLRFEWNYIQIVQLTCDRHWFVRVLQSIAVSMHHLLLKANDLLLQPRVDEKAMTSLPVIRPMILILEVRLTLNSRAKITKIEIVKLMIDTPSK